MIVSILLILRLILTLIHLMLMVFLLHHVVWEKDDNIREQYKNMHYVLHHCCRLANYNNNTGIVNGATSDLLIIYWNYKCFGISFTMK